MPESPLIEKEIAALADLEALVAARAKGETETELAFHRRREKEDHEYRSAARQLASRYKAEKAALEAEYQKVRDEILQTFEREAQAIEAEYSQVKQKIDAQAKNGTRPGQEGPGRDALAGAGDVRGRRDGAVKSRKQDEEMLAATRADFEKVRVAADPVLERCRAWPAPSPRPAAPPVPDGADQARRSRCRRSCASCLRC